MNHKEYYACTALLNKKNKAAWERIKKKDKISTQTLGKIRTLANKYRAEPLSKTIH